MPPPQRLREPGGGIRHELRPRDATGHDRYEVVRHDFRLNEDAYRKDLREFDGGLSEADVSWPRLTHESNTRGSHPTREPLGSAQK